MAKDDKTVVIMGPPGAGTTTLLSTLAAAWTRDAHGFSPDERFTLDQTGSARPLPAEPMGPGAAEQGAASPEYAFDLIHTRPDGAASRQTLRVTGVSGRSFIDAYDGSGGAKREAFESAFTQAGALILVWPITRIAASGDPSAEWLDAFTSLVGRMQRGEFGTFDVILIAFSFYEIAVAPAGAFGARDALDPARVRQAFREHLSRNDALSAALFELSAGAVPVEAIPVSSYGLLKGYGQSNWAPLWNGRLLDPAGAGPFAELLPKERSPETAHELQEFWTPLFVLDPFIRIAFGERHRLMFPVQGLLRPERPSAEPRTRLQRLRKRLSR